MRLNIPNKVKKKISIFIAIAVLTRNTDNVIEPKYANSPFGFGRNMIRFLLKNEANL